MAKYVITKSHEFAIENDVYFAYDLGEAIAIRDEAELETDQEWLIAEVLDRSNWLIKLVMKLARRGN